MEVAPIAQLVKGLLPDAEGPRFDSQTGRVRGKSTLSLWKGKRPAIKGLRPPEHHAGKSPPDRKKTPLRQNKRQTNVAAVGAHATPRCHACVGPGPRRELLQRLRWFSTTYRWS